MKEKLKRIAENSVELHNRCVLRHYTAQFVGDGSNSLTVTLPFQPDLIQLLCTDPRIMFGSDSLVFFNADLSGLGLASALLNVIRNGNLVNVATTTESILSRVTQTPEGALTITGSVDNFLFAEGLAYQLVATKLHEKTLKERYTEFVEGLTGSGTAQVCKSKINTAFTAAEWTALKDTRPNWTFKEV